jgi:hypothetical protein
MFSGKEFKINIRRLFNQKKRKIHDLSLKFSSPDVPVPAE